MMIQKDESLSGTLVLKPLGPRIDAGSAGEFRDAMDAASAAGDESVLLDLAQVDFIDSTGLGAMVCAYKRLARAGRRMDLCGVQPAVMQMFRLTRMDRVFRLHVDRDQALAEALVTP